VPRAALGNKAAEKGTSYMTQDREERDAPYWTIIAENGGGLGPPGSCAIMLQCPHKPCPVPHT